LERVGFLGLTRTRIRPRTHDGPPAQPPPVQHTAEMNFQDGADTWWCMGRLYGDQTRLITAEPAWFRWCSLMLELTNPRIPVSGKGPYRTELCPISLLPTKKFSLVGPLL
jgi:hypothetical protein